MDDKGNIATPSHPAALADDGDGDGDDDVTKVFVVLDSCDENFACTIRQGLPVLFSIILQKFPHHTFAALDVDGNTSLHNAAFMDGCTSSMH